jgi:hypothetical protein
MPLKIDFFFMKLNWTTLFKFVFGLRELIIAQIIPKNNSFGCYLSVFSNILGLLAKTL